MRCWALEGKHRTLTALLSLDTGLIDLELVREPLRDVVGHVEHSQGGCLERKAIELDLFLPHLKDRKLLLFLR